MQNSINHVVPYILMTYYTTGNLYLLTPLIHFSHPYQIVYYGTRKMVPTRTEKLLKFLSNKWQKYQNQTYKI